MPSKAKVLEYDVAVTADGTATSGLGGSPIPRQDEWRPEHLVLAGLVRCTLTSLAYHLRKDGLAGSACGTAHGVVTKREDDGLYAFVEIEASLTVDLEQPLGSTEARALAERAERGCFVGNSLSARPRYRWIVNGEEVL